MNSTCIGTLIALAAASVGSSHAEITNGGFETGNFAGWTADANWVIAIDSRGYYSGWQGKYWAWSGGKGEPATGKLRSNPFVLGKDRCVVRLLITGWNSVGGSGQPRKWNYVTLNLVNGEEIDRAWAPNTTAFSPVYLDGSHCRGQMVYVEAVDDADHGTYSMLGIDDVRMVAPPPEPADYALPVPAFSPLDPRKSVRLEDNRYLVEVSRAQGAITRLRDKQRGLELIGEPRLADNFRFTLPIPGKEPWQAIEANYIWGNRQKLSSLEAGPTRLTLHWSKPLVNYLGEPFDAQATMNIDLVPDGVLFRLTIDNRTRYQIGEVFFPLLGGLQGLGKTGTQMKATRLVRPVKEDVVSWDDVFRVFTNMPQSWLGDQGPEQLYSYPHEMPKPWVELFVPQLRRSVYFGARAAANRPVVLRLELIPGNSQTMREDGNWPRPSELKGQPAGISVCFVEFANAPASKTYEAPPVLVSFHDGGWREAAKIHERWKSPNESSATQK